MRVVVACALMLLSACLPMQVTTVTPNEVTIKIDPYNNTVADSQALADEECARTGRKAKLYHATEPPTWGDRHVYATYICE